MDYSAPLLRPLGVGDLLDATITLYRRNFLLFVGIGAVVLVPVGLLQVVQTLLVYILGGMFVGVALGVLTGILAFVGGICLVLAMITGVSEVYLGRRPTIGQCYSDGLRRFWGMLGLSILIGLAIGLLVVTVLGIPFALYFGVGWTLAMPALLLEGLGIRQAMGRSRTLVKGGWWRVLGILILIGILQWVLQMVFSLPQMVLNVFLLSETSRLALSLQSALSTALGIAAQIVGGPVWSFGLVLLYYDRRIRKEGFDLEMMARKIGGPSAGLDPVG